MFKTISSEYSDLMTIVHIIQKRAILHPDRIAYTFLENSEAVQTITYAELDTRAKSIAVNLRQKLNKGDRALLLYKPGLEYIIGFFGCLYAGVIAVPAYPPDSSRLGRMMPRLLSIVDDCKPKMILTTSDISVQLKLLAVRAPQLLLKSWLSTDTAKNLSANFKQEDLDASDVSFLQYTSGSTGNPKGVMITHENLIHNSETIHRAGQNPEGDRLLTWLPLYHDMGLIGIVIQTVYAGLSAWVMSPFDFLRNPYNWLNSISKYKISVTGGPNFAYQLCHSKITDEQKKNLDLSSWKMAYSGAEPIREETFNKFYERFSDVGFVRESFYTCYGLAESTVFVTGSRLGTGFIAQKSQDNNLNYVSSGQALLNDTFIKIVNPETKSPCPVNQVGEIWISSPSVAAGYWGRPTQSNEIFKNQVLGDDKVYLKSGDLAFMSESGEVFITGRIKDLIIVNGQNHYPSDIEDTVTQASTDIRAGCLAAFAIKGETTEKVILVAEVKKNISAKNLKGLETKIKSAVFTNHTLSLAKVVFVVAGTIPKTTSGKIQRNATKEAYLKNDLAVVKQDTSKTKKFKASFSNLFSKSKNKSSVEMQVVKALADELKVEIQSLSGSSQFSEIGLSSLQAVSVASILSKNFGFEVSPALFWSFKDVASLAQFIAKKSNGENPLNLESPKEVSNTQAQDHQDDIAIIGMSARLPGADNIEQFWNNLLQGTDSISKARGSWAGYIKDVDCFDPLFFGISPREAEVMDPQQRLALEIVWESLERAGIAPSTLSGTSTGVFMGVSSYDYADLIKSENSESNLQVATGNAHSIVANRISFLLNLKGPSLAIDTACSSSLVAVHEAIKALKFGDCSVAIAGGVNVLIDENITNTFAKAGMISPDGRCFTFDQKANGYVRGEGCGALILKPLSAARKDNNPILGVIRSSHVEHGGLTNSLTAPSAAAQASLIEKTYSKSHVHPKTIGYVEAHGTATKLGDPVELLGLQMAFDHLIQKMGPLDVEKDTPCYVGSVKSNIGHLEAAAGIAGLIKTILMLQFQKLPQTLHFSQLNSNANLNPNYLVINNSLKNWNAHRIKGENLPRRAAVSSFGFGGMNAHVVLEEVQAFASTKDESSKEVILVISAKNTDQLENYVRKYVNYLEKTTTNVNSIAYTSQSGRDAFNFRLAATGGTHQELAEKLKLYLNGDSRLVYTGQLKKNGNYKVSSSTALADIAKDWCAGATIQWEKLYSTLPVKAILPTYPFAKQKFWVESKSETKFNESLNLNQFFVRDHVVVDKHILPGVAHLEFVRKAAVKKWSSKTFSLRNVVWKKPIVVGDQEMSVNIDFKPLEESQQFTFEIDRYSQGIIDFSESTCDKDKHRSDFVKLREKAQQFDVKNDVYEHFSDVGLKYGPSFQCIKKLFSSDLEAFAELDFDQVHKAEKHNFELHPSLMDAALGACIGIKEISGSKRDRVYIPFSLEKIEIFKAVKQKCFAYARLSYDQQNVASDLKKFDVSVYDETGEILVQFLGVVVRPMVLKRPVTAQAVEFDRKLLKYESVVHSSDNVKNIPFFAGASYHDLIEKLNPAFGETYSLVIPMNDFNNDEGLKFLFELYKKLSVSKALYGKVIITCLLVDNGTYDFSRKAGVRGFVSTLKNAHAKIALNVLTVDESTARDHNFQNLIKLESSMYKSDEVVYVQNQRFQYSFEKLVEVKNEKTLLKFGGIYVISGGAGGIGRLLTEYLTNVWEAQVFVLGRSEANKVALAHGKYIQCDITNRADLTKAIQEVKAMNGHINGVIHAAGIANKKTLGESSWQMFSETLSAKVDGAFLLDELTKDLHLDFFTVTSSISSFLGDFGAGDYASSNAVVDDFVVKRNKLVKQGLRYGSTLSCNWPFWESGGMVMPLPQQQISENMLGFKPLPTSEALKVFERSFSSETYNRVVMYGDVKKISQNFKPAKINIPLQNTNDKNQIEDKLCAILSETLKIDKNLIDKEADLAEYGADSMTMMDFMDKVKKVYGDVITPAALFENKKISSLAQIISENSVASKTEITPTGAPVLKEQQALMYHGFQPLSKAQQAMWFIYELSPESHAYNIPMGLKINGPVNKNQVKRALEQLAHEQPQLRTVFSSNPEPQQLVLENCGINFKFIDVSSFDESETQPAILAEAQKPFDLTEGPCFRALLLKRNADEFDLIMTAHHIVFDGLSLMVVLKRFIAIYENLVSGQSSVSVVDQKYFEFIETQKAFLSSSEADKQLAYWQKRLAGELKTLQLPQDNVRPNVQSYNGSTFKFHLNKVLFDNIKNSAKKDKVTVNSLLLSAFYIFLNKYSGQDDLVVGTPVLGRTAEMINTVGYFVNVLPLREKIDSKVKVSDFIAGVHNNVGEALLNQAYPFPQLIEKLKIARDPSRSPLFQVCFVFQNMLKDSLFESSAEKKKYNYFHIPQQEGQFDLELEILDSGDHFTCHLKFNTDLFHESTIQRFANSYENLLNSIVADSTQKIADVSVLNQTDLNTIVNNFNETVYPYNKPHLLHHLFEEQVQRTPDHIALQFEDQTLTYAELNTKANKLAHYLITQGAGPDTLIGVCAQRSIEMVVSLYAILKAGAAYVPVEPTYPEKRLEFLFKDSDFKFVLTQNKFKDLVQKFNPRLFCVDADWKKVCHLSADNPNVTLEKTHLAYMIYTSGSTGEPKGAMNTHQGICNRLLWMQNEYTLKADDVVLQKTPFSFDVSVWEFFWPLMFGAKMVLMPPEMHKDASQVAEMIIKEKVTTLHFVPSMLSVFLDQANLFRTKASLRRVICSGEALPLELQNRFFKFFDCELHNLYGPTEASVDVTYWACDSKTQLNFVPIGKPIHNIKMHILDENFKPVPVGVGGELCISGIGLARGYHNRPELNVEKFITNPLDTKSRLYRTGDLARYNENGVIEYLGRIDHQVKIRGFRIELGEIESLLGKYKDIKDVVVVARSTYATEKELVAYVVSHDKKEIASRDLRDFLQKELPDYMVPAKFVFLWELPLSSNGKVDRKALPEPKSQRSHTEHEIVQPRNDIEEKIYSVWCKNLELEKLSVTDNFFDLGGNSLSSIRMVKNINDQLGSEFTVRDFYENPTIESLALKYSNPTQSADISEKLLKDANLSQEIQFKEYLGPKQVSKIFLTGVTGFLGAYLLKDLLETTSAQILCLVRCEDDQDGLNRIKANLKKYSIWKDDYSARISPIKGDLSQPYLGISKYQWSYLVEKIQVVYHNAAKVNFVQPYSYLKKENVSGTEEVLRLCSEVFTKPLHYISTVSVFDSSVYRKSDHLVESTQAQAQGLFSGYAQSKWVAEMLVIEAQARGLPACIYRPGTVTGDARTGISNPDDLMTRLLVAAVQLKCLPQLNRSFDMVPVDFVSQAIIKLSQHHVAGNQVFHIVNPKSISMTDLQTLYMQLGYELKDLEYHQWTQQLIENKDNALNVLLPLFTEKVSGSQLTQAQLSEVKPMVKMQSTQVSLQQLKINCPEITKELIALYLSQSLPQFTKKKSV